VSADSLQAAVVVPACNGAEVIGTALASIATSAVACRHEVEVVVVDDASEDDTAATVRSFADGAPVPVTVVAHDRRRGTGAARNTGVAATEAECLLFLDQDDEYLPDHLGRCLDTLAALPRVDVVRTGVLLDRPVHPDWEVAIADSLTQTVAVRAWAHRLVGGFLESPAVAVVGCDDVFYNRLLRRHCRGVRVPERTVRFRSRPGNSFDRQWEAKFRRPPATAVVTLTGARLAASADAVVAFEERAREVEARVARLRGWRSAR
jgi:glycosyltransferase involved in cell wall biosynthesis